MKNHDNDKLDSTTKSKIAESTKLESNQHEQDEDNKLVQKVSKVGAVFISISIFLFLAPLIVGYAMLGAIIAILTSFGTFALLMSIGKKYPLTTLLVIYVSAFLLLALFLSGLDTLDGGQETGWAIGFAAIPFAICFIIGNLSYHPRSVIFAIAMIALIAVWLNAVR